MIRLLFLPLQLLPGVIFGGYLSDRKLSPPAPVSFQLDQLDLAKSDAAGSLAQT